MYNLYNVAVGNVWKLFDSVVKSYDKLTSTYKMLHTTANRFISHANKLDEYSNGGNITKLEIAKCMTSAEMTQFMIRVADYTDDFAEHVVEVNVVLSQVKDAFADVFGYLFNTKVPMFNDSLMMNSTLWKLFLEPVTDSQLSSLIANYTGQRGCTFVQIITTLYEYPSVFLDQLARDISVVQTRQVASVASVRGELLEYRASCVMNEDFYALVDITTIVFELLPSRHLINISRFT